MCAIGAAVDAAGHEVAGCFRHDTSSCGRVASVGMSASELATFAIAHADALCCAAVAALRAVEDDDDDELDADDEFVLDDRGAENAVDADADDFDVDVDAVDNVDAVADAITVQTRREGCAVAAFHLLACRLGGVAVSRRHLEGLRESFGEDAVLVALSGVADALGQQGRTLADAEVVAVQRARADARQLLQSPHDVVGVAGLPGLQSDDADEAFADAGRQQVARALDAAVNDAGDDDDDILDPAAPVAMSLPLAAVLRIRAATGDAARALQGVAHVGGVTTSLEVVPAAADELLFAARGEPSEAIAVLVRAATSIAHSLPEGAPLSCAIVVSHGDLVDDIVAAAAVLPVFFGAGGRLALDVEAFALAGDLAELPGSERTVDARAPWGQERWELSALLSRAAFRGRDDDVAGCREVLVGGGERARLLVLGGPAGIGKSSLVRATLRAAGLFDDVAAVVWGAADPEQPTPYAAVIAMVRALARAPAGHPRAAVRITRLVTGLAAFLADSGERDELSALVDVVRDLVGAAGDLEDDSDRRGPRALRTSLRRAVLLLGKALLARAGDDRPLVLVVSGAEAMDAPTRDALQFVARQLGARVRVVLLTSSAKVRLPGGFEDDFEVTRKDIKPLDDKDGLAIARELLDLSSAADDAALAEIIADTELDDGLDEGRELKRCLQMLVERAKGSPLFVTHAVRWAVEGGAIKRAGFAASWHASSVDVVSARLPTRVDRLLAARVLRLPAAARQVLGHCAALGSTFLPAAVEFVGTRLGLSLDEVHQAVRLLTETGFLARSQRRPGAPIFVDDDDRSDDALLAFEHPLLRAAAEQALSDDETKAVHGVVADALEALMETAAIAPRLARHHKLAERRRQAVHHLVVAVRRARRLDDRQGATTMIAEALELVAADERDVIFTLQLELAAVLESNAASGSKQHKALKDALKQLVRAADKTADPRKQALAFARVARFNLYLGDVDKAEEAVLRALTSARDTTDNEQKPRSVRDVLRLLALIRFAARDVDGARRALDEARRLTPASERRVLGGLEHQAGLFRLESNDPLGALEHLLVAIAHKRATADLDGEAACLDAAADVYARCGHLWTALTLLTRTLGVRAQIGDDIGAAWSLKSRAQVLLMAGDVDDAVEAATIARARGRSLGVDRLEHQAALVVARGELARDNAVAAEGILDGMRRRLDEKRDPFTLMESELLSARAKWSRAQHAQGAARDRLLKSALARARAAVELGERRGLLSGQVLGNALLGDVLLSSGDVSSALPYAQRAAEMIDDRTATGLSVEDIFGPYVRALLALGDDDEASAVVARARSLLLERAQHLPEAWLKRFWAVPARQLFVAPSTWPPAPTTSAPVLAASSERRAD